MNLGPAKIVKSLHRISRMAIITLLTMHFANALGIADEQVPTARATVGVGVKLTQIVIRGSEIEVKPIENRRTPIIVRILATFKHGTDHRYDLEFQGLDVGRYDLRDHLKRIDGTSLEDVPPLWVEIETGLPKGHVLPSDPPRTALPSVGGYRLFASVLTALWLAVTFWLALGGKTQASQNWVAEHVPTPAELLKPLVQDARAGRLTPAGMAEIERLLFRYWRRRLGLEAMEPVAAMTKLREHPEAGVLLRVIEDWLHRPAGSLADAEIAKILEPYEEADDVEPLADIEQSGRASDHRDPQPVGSPIVQGR